MNEHVLVIDDDPSMADWFTLHLGRARLECRVALTAASGLACLGADPPGAVVLDLMLPDTGGIEVLRRVRARWPALPVVVVTAGDSIDDAVECMRLGASDFVQKPLDALRFTTSVRNALERGRLRQRAAALESEKRGTQGFARLAGESPAMRAALDLLRRAAASDVGVLLEGETGTGKEVAARAIHAESERDAEPFVAVNCGALPESLVESELFGHERGAFTGAVEARPGLFERANKGTIFLDEVGELPQPMQVKLLRVLQERVVQRIGGATERPVDVRVVCATNRDLLREVREGRFREDLYYRLDVLRIRLPPLRERAGDVTVLTRQFLADLARRHGRSEPTLGKDVPEALAGYPWPGNVRQLRNVVERALILQTGPEIRLEDLSDELLCHWFSSREEGAAEAGAPSPRPGTGPGAGRAAAPEAGLPDDDVVRPLAVEERRLIERALRLTGGNVSEAAARLGIGRATLYRRLSGWVPGGAPAGENGR